MPNRTSLVTDGTPVATTFDAANRPTSGGYEYDADGRLLVVERATDRIRFRYAGTTTAVAQVVDDATGTVIRNVTTGPEGTVLLDWSGTDRRLYGTNAHHDTTWTVNDAGTVTATLRYDPCFRRPPPRVPRGGRAIESGLSTHGRGDSGASSEGTRSG